MSEPKAKKIQSSINKRSFITFDIVLQLKYKCHSKFIFFRFKWLIEPSQIHTQKFLQQENHVLSFFIKSIRLNIWE